MDAIGSNVSGLKMFFRGCKKQFPKKDDCTANAGSVDLYSSASSHLHQLTHRRPDIPC